MKLSRVSLGIDISSTRFAVTALRISPLGISAVAPPLVHEFREERAAGRMNETEAVLREYVARYRLMGAQAFFVLPSERVYTMRALFPHMRDKDMRDAVGLELDRLFPLPPDALRYGYLKLPDLAEKGKVSLAVSAVSKEFLDAFEQLISRSELTPVGSAPMSWAAGVSLAKILGNSFRQAGFSALIRRFGGSVECVVFRGATPIYSSARSCGEDTAPDEGISLVLTGLAETDAGEGTTVSLYAPPGWFKEKEFSSGPDGVTFSVAQDFPDRAFKAMFGKEFQPDVADPTFFLYAYGAAAGGKEKDLQTSTFSGGMSPEAWKAVGACAVVVFLLGIAWPTAVAMRARTDLKMLDSRIEELRPFAEQHQAAMAKIDEIQEKLLLLREESAASGEVVLILKELTDRFPNGTWISSLRVEGRNVDIDGFSPSANDLFPALTRGGRFRAVNFGAPTVQQGDNLERFKLKGEYVPLIGAAASAKPDEAVSAKPDETVSAKPGGAVSAKPGGAVSARPGGAVSAKPGGTVSAKPDETVSAKPGGAVSAKPGGAVSTKPGGAVSAMPGGEPGGTPEEGE